MTKEEVDKGVLEDLVSEHSADIIDRMKSDFESYGLFGTDKYVLHLFSSVLLNLELRGHIDSQYVTEKLDLIMAKGREKAQQFQKFRDDLDAECDRLDEIEKPLQS